MRGIAWHGIEADTPNVLIPASGIQPVRCRDFFDAARYECAADDRRGVPRHENIRLADDQRNFWPKQIGQFLLIATKLSGQYRGLVGKSFVQFFFRLIPKFIIPPCRAMVFFPDFLRALSDLFFSWLCHLILLSPESPTRPARRAGRDLEWELSGAKLRTINDREADPFQSPEPDELSKAKSAATRRTN